jgi:hypothetical protein
VGRRFSTRRAALVLDGEPVDSEGMRRIRWAELDPRLRQGIVVAGAVEAGLKIAALIDLAQRPAARVRGSKGAWTAGIVAVNSLGVLPVLYLLRGRRVP